MTEAPSVIYEALPAVVDPSLAKTGFSLPRLARVVSGLQPSSMSTRTSFYSPLSSFTKVL
jgi:hypothetical protein